MKEIVEGASLYKTCFKNKILMFNYKPLPFQFCFALPLA